MLIIIIKKLFLNVKQYWSTIQVTTLILTTPLLSPECLNTEMTQTYRK